MNHANPRDRQETKDQLDAYTSSWSIRARIGMLLFRAAWFLFCRWNPKNFKRWRILWLRIFGATISGSPFVAPSCIIKIPWLLELEDHACLAQRSEVYNLGRITIRARAVVTQYVYLCAGTHDLSLKSLPLVVAPIEICEDAFVGAKALILPGVRIGKGAVVGAGAVVSKDVAPWSIVAGNPAKVIGERDFEERPKV